MIPFNYHHLYYFYTVVSEGTITKAAKKLLLAQPTLSAQIKQFESFLDVKLFDKVGRELKLTPEGRFVHEYSKHIFDLGNEMTRGLAGFRDMEPVKFQMGSSPYIPKSVVEALLRYVYQVSENAYVTIKESSPENLYEDLEKYQLDVVINDTPYNEFTDEKMENILIAKVPIVFCGGEKFYQEYKEKHLDLKDVPVIIPTSQSQIALALKDYFLKYKIRPNIIGEIQDVELVRRMLLAGKAVAPMNAFTVLNAPAEGKLHVLPVKHKTKIYDTIYMTYKRRYRYLPLIHQIENEFHITEENMDKFYLQK